jgi:hypothetical protein
MPGSEYCGQFPPGLHAFGDYRGVRSLATDARELDVTTLLAYLSKTGSFQTALDFAEG